MGREQRMLGNSYQYLINKFCCECFNMNLFQYLKHLKIILKFEIRKSHENTSMFLSFLQPAGGANTLG